jgi:serine/threonine protein kinase
MEPAVQGQPATEWQVGDVIDSRYEILGQIGVGGMGVVWKVHHYEWDRVLALKMPLPQLVGSLALKERYLREAETWVGLGVHPHIVQCWYVLNIEGRPCLFLDYMTGGSLKDRIDQKTIYPGKWVVIMELAMQVASGLAHSHSRGVVHRDVKPENLLFKADGTIGVTDFGLVKTALPESVERSTGLTRGTDFGVSGAGAYLGTPQYGAPEQWGAAERVGPAADIYAFGITLYEMCCGRRPFDVEGDPNMTLKILLNAHINTPPPDPREFFSEIPEDLVLLCKACLEKDPARRPPSMQAVHQVLSALHYRLTGAKYETVVALPNTANPDILNNTAVSLLSLDKRDEARQAWRRALRQESAHPECLYNLIQLERREGRIGTQEALRRLQQAKADYPLALFCIEQGLNKEAITILSGISTEDKVKKGLVQRALGDALMYTHQYFAAEKAYQQAFNLMPNDVYTHRRKSAAAQGRRDLGGHILFPLATPRFTISTGESYFRLAVGEGFVLCVTNTEFHLIDLESERVESKVQRLADARPVERIWLHGQRLLMQEQGAFQLRQLPDLRLIGRKGGRVLAVAPDLSRMVLLTREGPTLYSFENNTFEAITGADPEPGSHGPHAAFDASGTRLCLLLATGEVAQLDNNHRAIATDWPSAFEQPQNPTALAIGGQGTLYIGYACGTVNAYDVLKRSLVYTVTLPGPIHGLEMAGDDHRLVADLRAVKIVLDETGSILWQGPGPLIVEPGGKRLVSFARGVLQIHELRPFHLSRRWEQLVEGVVGLEIASNGGIAASWDRSGGIQIWEVDEEHRVYERSQLLSPGQTYQDLVSGALAFPEALASANQALNEGNLLEAYRQLLKARGVMGYGQTPAALDLNWTLIDRMGRDQVDAVWDRLALGGPMPGPVDISPAGDHLLVVFNRQVSVRLETPTISKILWAHTSRGRVLAARMRETSVILIEESGRGVTLALEDGSQLDELNLDVGPLVDAHLLDGTLLFVTASAQVGSFDLSARRITSKTPSLDKTPLRVFPWHGTLAIVSTESDFGVLELGKKPGSALQDFGAKSYKPEAPVTYAVHDSKHRIIALGMADGTLAITDAANGRLLYAVGKLSGAITGFALLSELTAAAVTTDRGQLYFWDLQADVALEGLLAHRGGITELRVDSTGRHLVTSGRDGQVRLWETSWTASLSLAEKPKLEWLPTDTALTKLARFFRLG